ncbi:ROK family protein [Marinilabiliaceae bacterium ANBcel2]|nr:ROK family protein [Marinilabiliaceae bacterium ANBcel2]
MDETVVGIDLGGTNMRAGLVCDGVVEKIEMTPVPETDDWLVVMNSLIETIESVMTNEVKGIGIGVPGIVDYKTGVVYDIQNIPSWKEVEVAQILSKKFNVPVYVNNDANCFAVGERYFGKGRNFDDFVGLITGTGLGAGIIKGGHLLTDQNCGAGEFGMIPYMDDNYEHYCSGRFFNNSAGTEGENLAKQALNGDEKAKAVFDSYGEHLANAIKTIIFAVDPAAIILGGSVSKSFEFFEEGLKKGLNDFPYAGVIDKLSIEVSDMPDIAILGAAALYFDNK